MSNFEFALCAFGAGLVVGAFVWNILKTKVAADLASIGTRLSSVESNIGTAIPTATHVHVAAPVAAAPAATVAAPADPLAALNARITALEATALASAKPAVAAAPA